jgi:hypothetical protein
MRNMNLMHFYVNHSEGFGDPINPNIHTNNIELRWKFLRKYVKRNVKLDDIDIFLKYFLWFYHMEKEKKYEFIIDILRIQPNLFNINIS